MMAVLKIKKSSHFSTYENELVQTNKISFKSRGFLVYLLSLPEDWEVSINYLCKHYREGKDFFYGCIDELKKAGYITHVRHRDEQGKITKGEYIVRESPQTENPEEVENMGDQLPPENLHPAKPRPAYPHEENPDDINKYKDTKETKKTKETAATKDVAVLSSKDASLLAAAHLQIIKNSGLSAEQNAIVEAKVKKLYDTGIAIDPTKILTEVIAVLEDPRAFTKSGNLFHKKLNTITKLIKSGDWQSPVFVPELSSPPSNAVSSKELKQKKLLSEINVRKQQKASFMRGMCDERFARQPEYFVSCEKEIAALDADISRLEQLLTEE